MADVSISPRNGAVAFASSLTADFHSFDIDVKQAIENVTPYGTNTCSKNAASMTPDFTVNVAAFARRGVAADQVGLLLGTSTNAIGGTNATGVSATFTLDTGITEGGPFLCESIKITHGRMRAAIPVAIVLKNSGDVTESWATP